MVKKKLESKSDGLKRRIKARIKDKGRGGRTSFVGLKVLGTSTLQLMVIYYVCFLILFRMPIIVL